MIRDQDSTVISANGEKPNMPGAGHQNRHRAQFAAHLGERLLDRGPVGDVGAHPECGDTVGAQVVGDTLRGMLIDVEDRHFQPAPAQFVAGRLAHARGAAGHHRDPVHRSPALVHSYTTRTVRLVGRA